MMACTAFLPALALVAHTRAEGMQLGGARSLANAELDPPARDQVEGRDTLSDAVRLVGRDLDDAVAEANVLRALTGGGQEHLGRRGVRVLLEEVVLDLPDVVVAELVGKLDLLQRVLQQIILVGGPPRPRQLVLVEDAEFHRETSVRSTRGRDAPCAP